MIFVFCDLTRFFSPPSLFDQDTMHSTVVHSRIALGQMLLESGPDAPKLEKMVLMLVTGRTFEATATAEHKGFLNSNLVQKLNFESFFFNRLTFNYRYPPSCLISLTFLCFLSNL